MKASLQQHAARALGLSTWMLLLAAFLATPAYACTPPPETPWFATETHLGTTNLPADVSVADAENGAVLLQNNSRQALEIVVSAQDQEGGSRVNVAPGRTAIFATHGDAQLIVNERLLTRLEYRNVIADNRPANPRPPQPQVAWAQVLIGQQSYYIQLQITYRLNEFYRSDSVYVAEHISCPPDPFLLANPVLALPLGGFLAGLIVTAVVAVLVFGRKGGGSSSNGSNGNDRNSP